MEIILSIFPDILEQFSVCTSTIMEDATILPIEERYYIAIIVLKLVIFYIDI